MKRIEVLLFLLLQGFQPCGREIEQVHGLCNYRLLGLNDIEGLDVVVVQHKPQVRVLLLVPLRIELVDKKTPPIGGGMARHGGNRVRCAEDALHGLEIFETGAGHDTGVVEELARIRV